MIGLRVRDAAPTDRDAIVTVTLSAYREYAALMPEIWERYRQNILETLAAVEPAAQIVAEQDGRIVGTVLLYPAGSLLADGEDRAATRVHPEVRLLAVAPAVRRRGIGRALMQECMRRARESGATVLTLHTTDLMRAATRLYERMGFRRSPELDFEPAPGVMVKGYYLPLEETAP
ncbi:MAG: GNAT family N-acetyltransferase [Candidatus Methylomirabilales bacterium]